MIHRKIYIFLFLIMSLIVTANCQDLSFHGRVSNSIYAFEALRNATSQESERTVRLYQYIRFNAGFREMNQATLNFTARTLTDLQTDLPDEQRFRAYRLSVSVKNLFGNLIDLEIGRQFLHAGIPFGSLDGMVMDVHPYPDINFKVFGGVESHLQRALKLYNFDEATVFGSEFSFRKIYQTNIQVTYLQRMKASETQWQIAGINLNNNSIDQLRLNSQFQYDFINSRFHRLYLAAFYTADASLNLYLKLKQQYPQVFGDSYFRIFNVHEYRQAQIGGNYALTNNLNLGLSFQYLMLKNGNGQRVFANINNDNGAVGLLFETGDLGNQISLTFDYGYEFTKQLSASVGIDYSRYRFEEIYDYESQVGNAVRVNYAFSNHLRTSLEYQWLTNQFADSDQRILNHIHFIW